MKAISGDEGDNNKQAAKTNPQGISFPRSSHGGSGKRLPGVKEHGLEQDVEILRAALWKASDDQVHASSPVKLRRLEAEKEGYERSPMQLAPPGKGFVESCAALLSFLGDGEFTPLAMPPPLLLLLLLLLMLVFNANSDVQPSNFFALPNFSQHAILNTNSCLAGSYSR